MNRTDHSSRQAYDVRVPAPHLWRSCPLDALVLCSSLLTLTGFVWDKYEPDQTKHFRFFEPNQAASGNRCRYDLALHDHGPGNHLYSPMADCLWIVPLTTPIISVLGYFVRSIKSASELRLLMKMNIINKWRKA